METLIEIRLREKRQKFHRMLIALGEEKYKEVIVGQYGKESTKELTEKQLDELIDSAKTRLMHTSAQIQRDNDATAVIKRLRNKCLLVLGQRGITASPKNWDDINAELAKKQYQWVLNEEQRAKGIVNNKGLYSFKTEADLKKLFNQLVAIRDAEKKQWEQRRIISQNN